MKELKGKKYISVVTIKRDIDGTITKGKKFKLDELKRNYPFIDFSNKDFFEISYESNVPDLYKVGDKVCLNPNERSKYLHTIYEVKEVIHEIKNNMLYTRYRVVGINSYDKGLIVSESSLREAKERYIISFSNSRTTSRPAIHQIDQLSFESKIQGTWKEMFVFDTLAEAVQVSEMFASTSVGHIINYVNEGKKRSRINQVEG